MYCETDESGNEKNTEGNMGVSIPWAERVLAGVSAKPGCSVDKSWNHYKKVVNSTKD